uniref:Uncharacterized protein n=1 Tax=Picea glauca TaxID=3330 RepID=A0A101M1F3_PICGL|nr:hypothetical protein ABT39_MTgene3789 [Picea glauca]
MTELCSRDPIAQDQGLSGPLSGTYRFIPHGAPGIYLHSSRAVQGTPLAMDRLTPYQSVRPYL